MIDEQIAKIMHEVNRAVCLAAGDTSQPAWEDAPEWSKQSCISAIAFHRTNPDAPASATHDQWMKERIEAGWIYGPTKNVELKINPSLVPYDELPFEQRVKDYLTKAVVHACNE